MNIEEIYNIYLGTSRRMRGLPWRPRQDFTGFDGSPEGFICKRLLLFFSKFKQILPQDFFSAPYELYKDESSFPLSFYTSQKAIAVYSTIQKMRREELPDAESQIKDIKDSLKYIASECVRKNYTLEQYCEEKSGYTYTFFNDYVNKRVNIYVLIRLPFFDKHLNSLNQQDRELFLKDDANSISKIKMRLSTSTRAKKLIDDGLRLIEKHTKNT